MDKLIKSLLELAKIYPNGFTVSIPDCKPIKEGWMVAMKETQNCFGMDGLKKVIEVATENGNIVGGWKDGNFYWDAILVYDNEDDATKAGIENEQLAIFDLSNVRVKRLD